MKPMYSASAETSPQSVRAGFRTLTSGSTPRVRVASPSGLVGRSRDLVRLTLSLRRSRLVTLVGPGGIGKTRLAVDCLRGSSAVFVNLVGVRDSLALLDLLRRACEPSSGASIRKASTSAVYLAGRLPRLLLLDNAEGLDEEARATLETLLCLAPGVRVLVTSRKPLGIAGELLYPLSPLSLSAAKRLFALHAEKRHCQPEALESAAGFPLGVLLLARGGALPSLSSAEQELLGSLSIFAGPIFEEEARGVGLTLDAAALDSLEGACLVGRDPMNRLRMLQPVREAARRLLTPTRQRELSEAHASYYESLAEQEDMAGLRYAEREAQAALDYLHETDGRRAAWLAVNLTSWAQTTGRLDIAESFLRRASEEVLTPALSTAISDSLGRILLTAGRWRESVPLLERAEADYSKAGSSMLAGRAAGNLSAAFRLLENAPCALRYALLSVAGFRACGDSLRLAAALNNLAQIHGDAERWEESIALQRECVSIAPTRGRSLRLAEALLHAGEISEAGRIVEGVLVEDCDDTADKSHARLLRALILRASPREVQTLLTAVDNLGRARMVFSATKRLVEIPQ
jgi:tetratricopeptide (TPR) repeat protein